MIFENEKIKLRALEQMDLNLLYQWENDPSLWQLGSTLIPFSKYTIEMFINSVHEDIFTSKQVRMMIVSKSDERAVGCVDLYDIDFKNRRAGIGILVYRQEDRQNNYAKAAIELIKNYASELLDLHQIYCEVMANNIASIKLFESCKFEYIGNKKEWIREGKNWIDQLSYQYLFKE